MADTMKFGPAWLRTLAGDVSQSAAPSVPPGKFKTEYRYGREEMLSSHAPPYILSPHLKKLTRICIEETQKPLAFVSLSDEEQRLMTQTVNSQSAIRPVRGTQVSARGGRAGLVIERRTLRGGRGRGEIIYGRGGTENGDLAYSRSRGPNKDGWEEVANRKIDRPFTRPYEEGSSREGGHPRFQRSMSNENWRDKGPANNEDEDEGDWRKQHNKDRWTTRLNWREPTRGGQGHEIDRRDGGFLRSRGFDPEDRGRRMDVPEWIDDGSEDVGSFDASGAFVSYRERPYSREKKRNMMEHFENSGYGRHKSLDDDEQERDAQHWQGGEAEGWESSEPEEDNDERRTEVRDGGSSNHSPPVAEETEPPHEGEQLPATEGGTPSSLPNEVMQDAAPDREKEQKITGPVVPMSHENALKWFYVDPQENLQGPFESEDMAQWFNAGYFTMCLKLKRGCDHGFQPLGDLMKQWGHVPFMPGPFHPPMGLPSAPTPQEAAAPGPVPAVSLPQASVPVPTQTLPQVPVPSNPPQPSSFSLGQGVGNTENLLVQQHLLLQHQVLQVQVEIRQLQMQSLTQLQGQDDFKALDPAQQQQVSLHVLQSNPLLQQRMQHLQQLQHMQQQTQQTQQQLQMLSQGAGGLPTTAAVPVGVAAGSSSAVVAPGPLTQPQPHPQPMPLASADVTRRPSSPKVPLPVSQPAPSEGGQGQGDIPSIWGSAPPAGVWPPNPSVVTSVSELENGMPPQSKADLEKIRKETEEYARRMEDERKRQEEIQKQHEELRRQAEALQREREEMQREKEELERQRAAELQKVEDLRRQQQEEQRKREAEEAQRRKLEEENIKKNQLLEQQRREEEREGQRRREMEEEQRQREEGRRRDEERRRLEEEEWRKQESIRQKLEEEERALQEMKHMEETRRMKEVERQRQREVEKQQEAEAAQRKKELEKQQQEALRRMQQQQALQNIQLPSSVNWAQQQQQQQQPSPPSRSLADIQQEEEARQLQLKRERQQMQQLALQEEQQKKTEAQKTWANNLLAQQAPRVKTLAEIQEEQERQLRQEKQKTQHHSTYQAKAMSHSQAATWGSGPVNNTLTMPSSSSLSSSSSTSATPWSGMNSIWGASTPSSIWGNAGAAPVAPKASAIKSAKESSNQVSSEFPSLHSQKANKSKQSQPKAASKSTAAPPKSKQKEEEVVQRLFTSKTEQQSKDEFTMWCEEYLKEMDVQVDIETFVSFLKAVDSPFEVMDYVKNYLGESKQASQFGKQFMERRSRFNNKAKKEKRQEEESIWGPAPAVNPQKIRGITVQTSNSDHGGFTEVGAKKGAKKKKKMQKLDGSALLGFTVAKDPNRKNAGEIESID